ncbi:hypothetical protein D3C84_980940 [compost metagenome]
MQALDDLGYFLKEGNQLGFGWLEGGHANHGRDAVSEFDGVDLGAVALDHPGIFEFA